MTVTTLPPSLLDSALSPVLSHYHPGLTLVSGQGSWVTDTCGRRIFDLSSGIASTVLGHCHPEVTEAASRQLSKLVHICTAVADNVTTVAYANELVKHTPAGLDSVFFCNSGAEAVEGALKLASFTTRRPAYIAFSGAFHGRTYGAVSVTANKVLYRRNYEPLRPSVYHLPFPRNEKELPTALTALAEMADRYVAPDQVAAVLIEPIQGEGGFYAAPGAFLEALRRFCDDAGALLVFDEVQSGFGRSGALFASSAYGVTPDILVLAKSIANGLPLGAVVAKRSLMEQWTPGAHGSTFGGNPVSCAAALATLNVILRDDLPARSHVIGERIEEHLRKVTATERTLSFRRMGAMAALDMGSGERAQRLIERLLEEDNILALNCGAHGEALRFLPALNVDMEELDQAMVKVAAQVARS